MNINLLYSIYRSISLVAKIVITGNKDASREAILNGEIGILVDPDNTIQIAETYNQSF